MLSTELPSDLECFKMFDLHIIDENGVDTGHSLYRIRQWKQSQIINREAAKINPLEDHCHQSTERQAVIDCYRNRVDNGEEIFQEADQWSLMQKN